jgi:hypothetical protein
MRHPLKLSLLAAAGFLFLTTASLALQSTNGKGHPQRILTAQRATNPIHVDGILSENEWQRPGAGDFVQRDPEEGGEPRQPTEVWIAYDDGALYVAARLYDSSPDSIVRRLGRRDSWLQSDWFSVYLDPYLDHRSGFFFAVNPAGSIRDGTLSNDSWQDDSWDGVWDSAAQIDSLGWTVEIRIPFSQLRFPRRDQHVWGINFQRRIQRYNERDYLVMVPRNERAFVSRFAHLEGIEAIEPPRHLEILPYAVSRAEYTQVPAGHPFRSGRDYFSNLGADIKWGITTNLTLDATVNPDFGQVEVDPAVVNLSAFETFFQEKRPFFIEGASLFNFGRGGSNNFWSFNWGNPNFFYSRRIGRPPQGYPSHSGFVDRPASTTILGAAKVTGKVSDGWSLGALAAVTPKEYARVDSSGVRFKDEIEPITFFGVLRSLREFDQGKSGLGVILTSSVRDLDNPLLRSLLPRRAVTGGIDGWTHLDRDKQWVITGWAGASTIAGSRDVILRLQQAPARYYQRPDADHVNIDSTATSLSGWALRMMVNKQKGNWQFNSAFGMISPGFDTNDLGFHWRSDIVNAHVMAGYQWYNPGKVFRRGGFRLATFRAFDFGGTRTGEGYFLFYNAQFLNYWGFNGMFAYSPETVTTRRTRGGPKMLSPSDRMASFGFFSDPRKTVDVDIFSNYWRDSAGSWNWGISSGIDWEPNSQLRIRLSPRYSRSRRSAQWVTRQEDPMATETYGNRYIFAQLDQTSLSMSTRISWTFTPKLSLQVYVQPLLATGRYSHFKELARPASFEFNEYGQRGSTLTEEGGAYTVDPDGSDGPAEPFTFGNPDFNFKSLRGNAVLRWEYRPGSTLFFVWTQQRTDFADPGEFNFTRDLQSLLTAAADNIFLVKLTYWLNP